MSYSSIRQVMLTRAARDEIENQRQAKRDKQKRERRVQDGETPERPPLIRTCLCLINATDTAAAAFVPVIAVNADPLLLILTKRAPRRSRGVDQSITALWMVLMSALVVMFSRCEVGRGPNARGAVVHGATDGV